MCFRDYGIMRLVQPVIHNIPDTGAVDTLIPANQGRIALAVQCFDEAAVGNPWPYIEDKATGFLIFAGNAFMQTWMIDMLRHGALPTRAMLLNFGAQSPTDAASWTEWVVPEQWLDKALRAMEKEFGGPF